MIPRSEAVTSSQKTLPGATYVPGLRYPINRNPGAKRRVLRYLKLLGGPISNTFLLLNLLGIRRLGVGSKYLSFAISSMRLAPPRQALGNVGM